MKRLILIFILGIVALTGFAQRQSFEFYYIAHDRTTPVGDLCRRLEEIYDMARSYDDLATVFYFPNYDKPKIVKINLPGDNRSEFEEIISELRIKDSHEIYADLDYENILNIVNEHDFIDESGSRTYTSVLFCWYVNPDFWRFGYNEKLIASIYFSLELNKYLDYVVMQIWHADDDGLEVDKELPFGHKNLCPEVKFILQQY